MTAVRHASSTRLLSRAMYYTVSTAWAAVMLGGGLWIFANGPGPLPIPTGVVNSAAATAVGGGQFIFLTLVADRLFPAANRRVVWPMEGLSFAVFIGGLVALVYWLVLLGGRG